MDVRRDVVDERRDERGTSAGLYCVARSGNW
jgi:hypothetical protein